MRTAKKVLVAGDEQITNAMVEVAASFLDMEMVASEDGADAVNKYTEAMKTEPFDVVILGLSMSGAAGSEECLRRLQSYDPNVKAILIYDPTKSYRLSFEPSRLFHVITKPIDLIAVIEILVKMTGSSVRIP